MEELVGCWNTNSGMSEREHLRFEIAMRVLPALITSEDGPSSRMILKSLAISDQFLSLANEYPEGTVPVERI